MNTLQDYGFTDRTRGLYSFHFPDPGIEPARVIRVDRGKLLLAAARGIVDVEVRPGFATGDWVAMSDDDGGPAVVGLLPRHSTLQRKKSHDPLSQAQVLAANIDVVGVVVPIDRPLSSNRLERTLVAAWDSGALPLVILTKADLSNRFDAVVAQTIEQVRSAEVVTTSATTGDGLDEVRSRLQPGETLAFLGPSGAGKSTLINALVGAEVQDTGEIRGSDGRGRHTTTARELIPLPGGAVLMDTPGVRGFALWDAEAGMEAVFGDIEALFGDCRFSDCGHGPEPGCAVRAAIDRGDLEERRWRSYLKMERELASLHRRQDTAAERQHSRGFHQRAKEAAMAKDYRNRFREM